MVSTVNLTVVDHRGQPWKSGRRWVAYLSHHHRHFLLGDVHRGGSCFAPRAGQTEDVLTVDRAWNEWPQEALFPPHFSAAYPSKT